MRQFLQFVSSILQQPSLSVSAHLLLVTGYASMKPKDLEVSRSRNPFATHSFPILLYRASETTPEKLAKHNSPRI
jgi:hypothetical protein